MTTPSPEPDATPRAETDVKASAPLRSQGVQFVPGTIIASRYRIAGMLGSGGMGEVYREDLSRLLRRIGPLPSDKAVDIVPSPAILGDRSMDDDRVMTCA
jgi:hypothetical protein